MTDADANRDEDVSGSGSGVGIDGKVTTRPVVGGTGSRMPQASAASSNMTATSTWTISERTITHTPSANSLRNIHVGGAGRGRGGGTGIVHARAQTPTQNAALTGAALAFSNARSKSESKGAPVLLDKHGDKNGLQSKSSLGKDLYVNTYSGKDGALAAAMKVGPGGVVGGRTRSPSKVERMDERMGYGQQILGREKTGGSETTDGGSIGGSEYQGGQRDAQKRVQQRSNGYLQAQISSASSTPESSVKSSAAFMAANVAAKRSRDNSPNQTGQSQGMGGGVGKQASPLPSRRQSYASSIGNTSSVDSGERRLDVSNIPPTSSLVGMWEQTDRGVRKAGGNEVVTRQESPRKRPASSHAPIPISRPAMLTRPVSSHAPKPELLKSITKPLVQPRSALSQPPISEKMKSTSTPLIQPRTVSSHTPGSEAVKPSPKPPVQKPVIHNTRPASSHGPLPNLSTKPSIQTLSRPVSAHGPPPTKPSAKPPIQSIRPASSHALESTESLLKPSVQKPSIPPPRRTANVPAPDKQSTTPPMQAPQARSMQTPILNFTASIDSPLKPPTQHPRRASTIQITKPSKSIPASKPFYNDDDNDASSDDSFVSASSQPKPRSPSWRAKVAQQNRRQSSSVSPMNMNANSLADAIVAGSLASSRASSPSIHSGGLRPPAPPPTRRHKNIFHSDNSRTPTPPQTGAGNTIAIPMLKTTMRKPKTGKELREEENEGEKRRGKKHLVKKHPNKHHEGDRKRWRDVVTERERKRYEAVWASNKGLFPYTVNERGESIEVGGAADSVPGVVVRDIWERSRLGGDVLEEVWGLVERRGMGMRMGVEKGGRGGRLGKEEFVVGLWLIDQRLKGRKLPGRVSESVWRSVGGLGGIKVKDRVK
ncbi:hypothetical protein SBOR_5042 [Sclerotinia borealis F-4128]|uniref:EH domain-containing protein n=1 Tax=Sclerotinia borealis (strain F-4128) TaxID=1432307 RepID=W9CCQ7_SCLBF|nr:hypothetical protein SBOR_5042 [Sclerotinia borealis F-4128]